jgi:hypothetical protein
MGICSQLYDKPFQYGFMIDYNKKHGKYPFTPMENERLEFAIVDVAEVEKEID